MQFLESWCMVSEEESSFVQPRSDFGVRPEYVPGRRHGSRGRLMAGEEHGDRFIPQQGFGHGLAVSGSRASMRRDSRSFGQSVSWIARRSAISAAIEPCTRSRASK